MFKLIDPPIASNDLLIDERKASHESCAVHPKTEDAKYFRWDLENFLWCTLPKGHKGDHIAHGANNAAIARWNDDDP